jgi:low temperature requirement protein LtrA
MEAHVPEDVWKINMSHEVEGTRAEFNWQRHAIFDHTIALLLYELVLAHPTGATDAKTATTLIIGPSLFVGGTLLFKRVPLDRWPLSHLVGLGLLLVMVPAVSSLSPLGLAALSAGILVLVAIWETLSLKAANDDVAPTTRHP